MKLVKGMVTTLFSIIFMTANIANAANTVTGDYNGDGNQDSFNQADNKGGSSSLTANAGGTIANFHISWTGAHPDISEIEDWSAHSYGAFSANLNSSPGDELLLLGKKEIILLHGDIITPILIPKDVQNAIVSWSSSGVATYTSFDLDADPDQFNVLFGDFDGDGYQEFVLQAKSSGSTSYIMNSDGSISETLSNGTHGMDWSAASVTLTVSDLNGDGIDDLSAVSTDSNEEDLHIYMNNGKVDSVNTYFGEIEELGFNVGAIAGEFRVDEGGQANYSVPIYTPVGVAGISPPISLNYNSGSGNGFMGVGWHLNVVSAISRCAQSIEVDGKYGSVNFDSEDRFCLRGQRLVAIDGEYGADQTEYRTLIDSQTKIVSYGTAGDGPSYFRVWHKDGSINDYGFNTNSKFFANLNGVVLETVMTWAQTSSEDRYGNKITYNYSKDEVNGENRIDSVTYDPDVKIQFNFTSDRTDYHVGYYKGGKTQLKDRLSSIEVFDNDIEVRKYEFDYQISGSQQSRLKTITESKDGVELQPTTFTWSEALKGIQKDLNEENDGIRMSSGTFANLDGDLEPDWLHVAVSDEIWVDADSGQPTILMANRVIATRMQTHDFTGEEYVRGCEGYVKGDIYGGRNFEVHDIDGNGRDEVIATTKDKVIAVFFNEHGCLADWNERSIEIADIDTGSKQDWFFGDVNGDALPDIVYTRSNKTYIRFNQMNDNSSDHFSIEYNAKFNTNAETGFSGSGSERFKYLTTSSVYAEHSSYGDFNGDGLVDLLVKESVTKNLNPEWCADISPGDPDCNSYQPTTDVSWVIVGYVGNNTFNEIYSAGYLGGDVNKNSDVRFADLNFDGMIDLVFRNSADDRWHYKIFTGKSFLASKSLLVDNDHPVYFGDHDQDGLTEVYFIEGSKLRYREFQRDGTLSTTEINTGVGAERSQAFAQIDLNGDGELDIYSIVEDAHTTYTHHEQHVSHNKTPFVARDKIIKIDNGMGNETEVKYKSLTDPLYPDLYDDDNGAHQGWSVNSDGSLTFNNKGPTYVVQRAESLAPAFDDVNNKNAIEYRYGKLRSHSRYGSLGFEWLETIDEQTDMIARTTYRQEYPFIGYPEKSEVWYSERVADKLISSATSTYDSKSVGTYDKWNDLTSSFEDADILFPYLSRTEELSYDFNVTTLKAGDLVSRSIMTSEYNNYGDPTLQNAYTCTGSATNCETSGWLKRIKTVNTYYPENEASWILGRLKRATVTHYASGQPNITRTTKFAYNATTGILEQQIIEPDSTDRKKYLKTVYSHDSAGNVTRTTMCDNAASCSSVPTSDPYTLYNVFRTNQSVYDADKRYVEKILNGYGQVTSEVLERNELGQPTRVKDINGNETVSFYGTFGQDFYTKSATGGWSKQITRLCSDDDITCPTVAHVRVEATSADGSVEQSYADILGRTVKTSRQGFGAYDLITETAYDDKGLVWYTTLPYKSTESTNIYKTYNYYDVLDRIIRVTYPDGSEDFRYYDGYITSESAVKTRVKNAQEQTKTEYTNAAGNLVKVLDNKSNALTYVYNAVDDLLSVSFDGALQSEIEYDDLGRKIKMWDYDKGAQNGLYWSYTYSAAGELVTQVDPKGQQVNNYYDREGRKIRQIDQDSAGSNIADFRWVFDNSTTLSNSIGKLTDQYDELNSEYSVELAYDSFGRNDVTTTTIDGNVFVSDQTFDSIGRVYESYDPSGGDNGLRYTYNGNGYLSKITETRGGDSTVYRTIKKMDAFGNVTEEMFGNGVVTEREYEPTTGRLNRITTADGATLRQNLEYQWDNIGRLEYRKSITKSLTETFGYDDLNQVESVNGTVLYEYHDNGNIKTKNGLTYTYGAECNGVIAGHHAVTKAGDNDFCYDENGNVVSDDDRTFKYSIFDKATEVKKGAHTTEFAYSASRSRYKRIDTNAAGTTTTYYLGGVEYIQKPDGQTIYRRSIPGAVIEVPSSGSMTTNYLHTDHLGSTDVITKSTGELEKEYSFDVFGNKRLATNWTGEISTTEFSPLDITSRSYTGHESADEVGIIHMNGRIYDANLGRFLQADPFVDGATDSQGYNRYTYVRNNPIAYTDPTGFRRSTGLKRFGKAARRLSYAHFGLLGGSLYNNSSTARPIMSAASTTVGSIMCPVCAPFIAAFNTAHLTAVSGGNAVHTTVAGARAYVTAYISAQVSAGIGNTYTDLSQSGQLFASSVAHGTLGGVMSVLNGGKFGHGFASSFLSKYIGVKAGIPDIMKNQAGGAVVRTMVAGMIGGTISQITGGKFANGAVQSALQWAFNAESKRKEFIESPFENWKGHLAGVTIGASAAKNYFGVTGSVTIAYDVWGNYIIVVTPETGFSSKSGVSAFARVVAGVNNDVSDLEGMSISGSAQLGKFSGSASLPSYQGSWPIAEFGFEAPLEKTLAFSKTASFGITQVEGNFLLDLRDWWSEL
jgi:RHS repeat-associated protein